jgi:hypothetical protein
MGDGAFGQALAGQILQLDAFVEEAFEGALQLSL